MNHLHPRDRLLQLQNLEVMRHEVPLVSPVAAVRPHLLRDERGEPPHHVLVLRCRHSTTCLRGGGGGGDGGGGHGARGGEAAGGDGDGDGGARQEEEAAELSQVRAVRHMPRAGAAQAQASAAADSTTTTCVVVVVGVGVGW